MQLCCNPSKLVVQRFSPGLPLQEPGHFFWFYNPKKYLTQSRRERRGKTLRILKNGSILTINLWEIFALSLGLIRGGFFVPPYDSNNIASPAN
jgi:hypothetical protein